MHSGGGPSIEVSGPESWGTPSLGDAEGTLRVPHSLGSQREGGLALRPYVRLRLTARAALRRLRGTSRANALSSGLRICVAVDGGLP